LPGSAITPLSGLILPQPVAPLAPRAVTGY
jgi:hypothetical protein